MSPRSISLYCVPETSALASGAQAATSTLEADVDPRTWRVTLKYAL